MMQENPKVFRCEDVKWVELEKLFEEMKRKRSGEEIRGEDSSSLNNLDFVVIDAHVYIDGCQPCKERLNQLTEKYKVLWESPEKPNEG